MADRVTIAIASNFSQPMRLIANQFSQSTGHKVTLVYGSSAKFYAQIAHGAPFDVFLSADQAKVKALIDNDLAVKDTSFTYAVGRLAFWSKNKKILDGATFSLPKAYNKLAIANPKLAPYGIAAMDALRSLDLYGSVKIKLIFGENISQTYQFIRSGTADIGIVAMSQIRAKNNLNYWQIPTHLHQPIKQDAVLLNRGKDNVTAKEFLTYLGSEAALNIIKDYGYSTDFDKL